MIKKSPKQHKRPSQILSNKSRLSKTRIQVLLARKGETSQIQEKWTFLASKDDSKTLELSYFNMKQDFGG